MALCIEYRQPGALPSTAPQMTTRSEGTPYGTRSVPPPAQIGGGFKVCVVPVVLSQAIDFGTGRPLSDLRARLGMQPCRFLYAPQDHVSLLSSSCLVAPLV